MTGVSAAPSITGNSGERFSRTPACARAVAGFMVAQAHRRRGASCRLSGLPRIPLEPLRDRRLPNARVLLSHLDPQGDRNVKRVPKGVPMLARDVQPFVQLASPRQPE